MPPSASWQQITLDTVSHALTMADRIAIPTHTSLVTQTQQQNGEDKLRPFDIAKPPAHQLKVVSTALYLDYKPLCSHVLGLLISWKNQNQRNCICTELVNASMFTKMVELFLVMQVIRLVLL